MARFKSSSSKSRKWIKGASRDWYVPFKCNLWFQLALLSLIPALVLASMAWMTGSAEFIDHATISFSLSLCLFGLTEFGRGTVKGYRCARQTIERNGMFDKRVQVPYGKKTYCFRAGARAAAGESGLSNELIPPLANRWRLF